MQDLQNEVYEIGEAQSSRHAFAVEMDVDRLEFEVERIRRQVLEAQKAENEAVEVQQRKHATKQLLEAKIQELEECRREAYTTRSDFGKVFEEIETYARILETLEVKVMEAEERADRAEHESYEAQRELAVDIRRLSLLERSYEELEHRG